MTRIATPSMSAHGILPLGGQETEKVVGNAPLYPLFSSLTDHAFIDAKLSSIRDRSTSETDRLKSFIELRDMALSNNREKFDFVLMADHKNDWWRFEFSIDNQTLFDFESRTLNNDHQAFAKYEETYLIDSFMNTVSNPRAYNKMPLQEIVDALRIMVDPQSSLSHEERLDKLQALTLTIPAGARNLVKYTTFVNQINSTWSYQLSVNSLELFESEPIDIEGSASALNRFQYLALLQTMQFIQTQQNLVFFPYATFGGIKLIDSG